jgi:hypothetical protein
MCFRYRLPTKYPVFEHILCGIRELQSPEFRTRFHRKTSTECWSLAASEFTPGLVGEIRALLQTVECKTGIYNILQGQGSITRLWRGLSSRAGLRLIAFNQVADALRIPFAMAIAGDRVRAAGGLNTNLGP